MQVDAIYTANEPHKFGIKFWLAVVVQTKYTLNGFPCTREDETRCSREKKNKITLFSSNLYKSENCTLTVYKSKPKVKVLLLSTKHTGVRIEDNYKRVPETIAFNNKTKYDVDVVDQMTRKYSVKARSFRRPVQVFFNILDLVAINAWILYKEYTRSNISRKKFIFCLAEGN